MGTLLPVMSPLQRVAPAYPYEDGYEACCAKAAGHDGTAIVGLDGLSTSPRLLPGGVGRHSVKIGVVNERTTIERVNGRFKDEFGGSHVRVRGAAKVMCHCMFGILALTADQLMRLIT